MSTTSRRFGATSNLDSIGIDNIDYDAREKLRLILNDSIKHAKDKGVDAVTGDVRLPKAYVIKHMHTKLAFGRTLETSITARHRPTTIRKGTYNPIFTNRQGVTVNIGRNKSPVTVKGWFGITLRGSGYKAVAYRERTGKPGRKGSPVKVVYAPSVNQIYWDVVKDTRYDYQADVIRYTQRLITDRIHPLQ